METVNKRSNVAANLPRIEMYASNAVFFSSISAICFSVLACVVLGIWLVVGGAPNVRGVEDNVIFTIQQLLLSQELYGDPSKAPFQIVQYSPLFYYVCASVASLIGVGAENYYGLYMIARGVSTLVELGRIGIAWWILRKFFKVDRRWASLGCAVILIGTAPWNFLARPDSITAFATLGAIACMLRMYSPERSTGKVDWWLILALALGWVATFAKQNGLLVIMLVLSFLFLTRDWRRLMLGAGFCVFAGAVIFWLADQAGSSTRAHLVDGVSNGIDIVDAFTRTYFPFWSTMAVLFGISALLIIRWTSIHVDMGRRFMVYALIVFAASATILGLKAGSANQYYFDFMTVAVISGCGYFFSVGSRLKDGGGVRSDFQLIGVSAIACLLVFISGNHLYESVYRHSKRTGGGSFDSRQEIVALLKAKLDDGQYFFSLDGTVDVMFPERSVMKQKDVISISYQRGLVDYSEFGRMVDAGEIQCVVVPLGDTLDSFAGFSFDHYVKYKECGEFSLYLWKAG